MTFNPQRKHRLKSTISAVALLAVVCISRLFLWPVSADDNRYNGLTALSTPQIKTVLINHSVTGTSPDSGFSFTVFYPKYGRLEGEAGLWGLYQDEGRWSVKDGIYCARWNRWSDNKEHCYRVYLDENDIYWVRPDGILQSQDLLLRKE